MPKGKTVRVRGFAATIYTLLHTYVREISKNVLWKVDFLLVRI